MIKLEAANDNWRRRTRADEQYDMIRIVLGLSVLFAAIMWLAGRAQACCRASLRDRQAAWASGPFP
jgi:hypothetical protein